MSSSARKISVKEFKDLMQRRAKHREFTRDEYRLDLINWRSERRNRSGEIGEFCLIVPLGRGVCLKIYTSIDRETCISRDIGKDSIKIVIARDSDLIPIRERVTHTYRKDNWQSNFDKNLIEALEKLYGKKNIKCSDPKCRGKFILKRNRNKDETFLGCTEWPKCIRTKALLSLRFAGN